MWFENCFFMLIYLDAYVECVLKGVEYEDGDRVQTNCTTLCICTVSGEFNCTTVNCSYDGPICRASGDPHYMTFDGYSHHFQGTCEYVLTKPCDSNDFVISASNAPCGNNRVSCVKSVRVNVTNENLEILLQRGERGMVSINGLLSNSSEGTIYQSKTVDVIRIGSFPYVFLKSYGLRIFWSGVSRVDVTTSTLNQNKLCGLCGTYDNDSTNDRQKPDKTLASTVNEFGDSWLLPDPTNPECGSTKDIGKRNVLNFDVRCYPNSSIVSEGEMRCAYMSQDPFTPCTNVVNPSQYINDCEFDYFCTNEAEREKYYCDILSTYASACAYAGVTRSIWRSSSVCRKSRN